MFELILIVVFIFLIAITFVFSVFLNNELNTEIQTSEDMSNISKTTSSTFNTKLPATLDGGFMTFFFLSIILMFVAGWNSQNHPILFMVMILVVAMVMFIGAVLTNTYAELSEDQELGSAGDSLAFTKWTVDHLVEIIIGIVLMNIVIIFMKDRVSM